MSRYYGYVLIEFTDGATERVGGNRHRVHEGQLVVLTEGSYGAITNARYFPLANVKTYRWEGE